MKNLNTQHTDRELLELAAKAAGVPAYWSTDGTSQARPLFVVRAGGAMGTMPHESPWNPLAHDADALRLAVALRMEIDHNHPSDSEPWVSARAALARTCHVEDFDDEGQRLAAACRAIVRAAAAIGEAMS